MRGRIELIAICIARKIQTANDLLLLLLLPDSRGMLSRARVSEKAACLSVRLCCETPRLRLQLLALSAELRDRLAGRTHMWTRLTARPASGYHTACGRLMWQLSQHLHGSFLVCCLLDCGMQALCAPSRGKPRGRRRAKQNGSKLKQRRSSRTLFLALLRMWHVASRRRHVTRGTRLCTCHTPHVTRNVSHVGRDLEFKLRRIGLGLNALLIKRSHCAYAAFAAGTDWLAFVAWQTEPRPVPC